jgi:transcriptional regulator of acetoin/glycerol metabolism
MQALEHELIRNALTATNGNIVQAAARLGIHRATLSRKMKRFGLYSQAGVSSSE